MKPNDYVLKDVVPCYGAVKAGMKNMQKQKKPGGKETV